MDTRWGGFPKKPALSLAILRASPASIRISPGRNRELNGLAHRTPAGPLAGSRKPRRGLCLRDPLPSILLQIAALGRSVSRSDVSQEIVSQEKQDLTERVDDLHRGFSFRAAFLRCANTSTRHLADEDARPSLVKAYQPDDEAEPSTATKKNVGQT